MSDADGREAGGQVVSDNAAREFEWAELQQHLLREEVQRKKEFREIFEAHEKVIAEKESSADATGQPDTNPDLLREMAETLAQRDRAARRMAARGVTEADASSLAKAEDPQLAEFAARVRERYEAGESPESIARWLRDFLPSGVSSALDLAAIGAVMNPARLASIMASVETIDRGPANSPANTESSS